MKFRLDFIAKIFYNNVLAMRIQYGKKTNLDVLF